MCGSDKDPTAIAMLHWMTWEFHVPVLPVQSGFQTCLHVPLSHDVQLMSESLNHSLPAVALLQLERL